MIPRGKSTSVSVTGHSLPSDSSYERKDVVIGRVKLLLKIRIKSLFSLLLLMMKKKNGWKQYLMVIFDVISFIYCKTTIFVTFVVVFLYTVKLLYFCDICWCFLVYYEATIFWWHLLIFFWYTVKLLYFGDICWFFFMYCENNIS